MPLIAPFTVAGRDLAGTATLRPSGWVAALHDSGWKAVLMDTRMRADSLDYVNVTLIFTDPATGVKVDVSADPVAFSFNDGATKWPAEHAGGDVWRVLVGPGGAVELPTGINRVAVYVTDTPTAPALNAGNLYIEP